MQNNYEAAEITEISRAQSAILGWKAYWSPWDSDSDRWFEAMIDDED